jgi:hypothetical protein
MVALYRKKFGISIDYNLTFTDFIDRVTDPVNPITNKHWNPQSRFCNMRDYPDLFNFVGNMEQLSKQALILFKCTNTWDKYASHGWGPDRNTSLFAEEGSTSAPHATKSLDHNLVQITPEIRKKVRAFFKDDYNFYERIQSPIFNHSIWI